MCFIYNNRLTFFHFMFQSFKSFQTLDITFIISNQWLRLVVPGIYTTIAITFIIYLII